MTASSSPPAPSPPRQDPSPGSSARWQMVDATGRIFLMYGESHHVEKLAHKLGYTHVERSGLYDYGTNTIIGARDGAVSYEDHRGRT